MSIFDANDIDIFNLDIENSEFPANELSVDTLSVEDLSIDNFYIGDIDNNDNKGNININLDITPLDFDFDISDLDNISSNKVNSDNVDYHTLLQGLQPLVEKTQRTINLQISSLNPNFDLPITPDDFKILSDVQFKVYYTLMSDLVKKHLSEDFPMPSKEESCEYFLEICEETEWYFGLYKDEVINTFYTNYEYILEEIDSYRMQLSSQKDSLFENADITNINLVQDALNTILTFPKLCAKYILSVEDLDLNADIFDNIIAFNMNNICNNKVGTIQDLLEFIQNDLKYDYLYNFFLNDFNIDISNFSLDEIIRLLLVSSDKYIEESLGLLGLEDVNKGLFEYLILCLKENEYDYFAFLILSLFLVILVGTTPKSEKSADDIIDELCSSYLQTITKLHNTPEFRNPAFIVGVTIKNGKTFIDCSRGRIYYPLEEPFYLIAGTSNSLLCSPLAIKCSCEDCTGCLFPPNKFLSELINWTQKGHLDNLKSKNIKYKAYLTPRELDNLSLPVTSEDNDTKHIYISQELEKWFLNFQDYITKFHFIEDNYNPSFNILSYSGPFVEGIHIPEIYPVNGDLNITLSYIENFNSKADNTYALIDCFINNIHIPNGEVIFGDDNLFISFFVEGSLAKQIIELPLNILLKAKEDTDIPNPIVQMNKDLNTTTNNNYTVYRHRAYILSELTGNAFDVLEKKARNLLIGTYGFLLKFDSVKERMLRYILSSYSLWLESKEYLTDVVNLSVLKSLLSEYQGKDNLLANKTQETITDDDVRAILDLSIETFDISDIVEYWGSINQDILAQIIVGIENTNLEYEYIFYALLDIPKCRDFLLSLQYKIVISLICADKYTRLPLLLSSVPKSDKIFKQKDITEINNLNTAIAKEYKEYKNISVIPTTDFIRCSIKQTSSEDLSLLRTLILSRNIFGIFNTLINLNKKDLIQRMLIAGNITDLVTIDYLTSVQNEVDFIKDILPKADITTMLSSVEKELLELVYEGVVQDIQMHNKLFQVVAYDLIINIYSVLDLEFETEDPDLLYGDTSYFDSLSLTYCLAVDEAICDINENKNRLIVYREKPECFPFLRNLNVKNNLKDLLFMGGDF